MAAPFHNVCPKTRLVFEKSNFSNPKSSHNKVVTTKYFTHNATIILPCYGQTAKLPSQISEIEKQLTSYLVKDVPLHFLVDKYFVEAFAKRGQLYVLSHKRCIDTQNCVAIIPTGHLILHVTKDTYEQLGLEGKPSMFSYKKPTKYVVDIDLKADSFTPGRKGYDRVLWCLRDRLDLTFHLLLSWSPHDEKVCPSSVEKFFLNKGLGVAPVPLVVQTTWHNKMETPVLNSATTTETDDSCGREAVWEWFGAVACGIDMSESCPDSFVSTLSCPTPSVPCDRCCVLTITGFLTPAATSWLLDRLRSDVENSPNHGSLTRWGSLTLHGFEDSPVSVSSREHGFFLEGDNLHSFVVFNNQDYWLYSAYGQHDLCQ